MPGMAHANHLDSQASSPCQNLQSKESRDTPINAYHILLAGELAQWGASGLQLVPV